MFSAYSGTAALFNVAAPTKLSELLVFVHRK